MAVGPQCARHASTGGLLLLLAVLQRSRVKFIRQECNERRRVDSISPGRYKIRGNDGTAEAWLAPIEWSCPARSEWFLLTVA